MAKNAEEEKEQILEEEESDDEIGGYDYEFVNPGPSDDQMCPICHLVARKACQANCCGKIFCKGCLKKHRQFSNDFNCPNCRKELSRRYFKDTRIEHEILHLQIYCINKNEGCSWKGNLKEVNAHATKCSTEGVKCDKCDEHMVRNQLKSHNSDKCLYRDYKCPNCKVVGIYKEMTTSHLEECPDLVLTCPNEGCEDEMKRQEMGAHRENCSKEVIKCSYHDIGCQTETKREMMDEHMETNTQVHLQNLVNTIREQEERKCPLVIKFSKFSEHGRDEYDWYSFGFYTSAGGYKLRLRSDVNGYDSGKDTHVSFYVNLMPGEYDDTLEWPFRGEVTVELLNQLEDKRHYKKIIYFNDKTPDEYKNRKNKEDTLSWGLPKFLHHSSLNSSTNTQYLMNDTLYFRVSVNVHSKTKPWLADTI